MSAIKWAMFTFDTVKHMSNMYTNAILLFSRPTLHCTTLLHILLNHLFIFRWLTIPYNRLISLPANFHLPKLIHVNLSNNQFTEIPQELSHLSKMQYCFLNNNKITELDAVLAAMEHVTKIDLQDNPIIGFERAKVSPI